MRYTDLPPYEAMDDEGASITEDTFGEHGRPNDLADKVALGLSSHYEINHNRGMADLSKTKWHCGAEVEDAGGDYMEVLLTCELEIDGSFISWLLHAL